MSEKEVMDQQSKSNFNSPPGPGCLATKQFIIKKFLCFIINLDLKEMLKILGQILLCYFGANQEQFIEVNRATINWREKNYLHVLWKKLIYALSTMLGSTYYTFICLVLQKYGYFLKQIIDLDFFFVIYTSCATVISNIYKAKCLDLEWTEKVIISESWNQINKILVFKLTLNYSNPIVLH